MASAVIIEPQLAVLTLANTSRGCRWTEESREDLVRVLYFLIYIRCRTRDNPLAGSHRASRILEPDTLVAPKRFRDGSDCARELALS